MELLGRVGAAVGISLILTMLLLVLYQDVPQEPVQAQGPATAQAASGAATP